MEMHTANEENGDYIKLSTYIPRLVRSITRTTAAFYMTELNCLASQDDDFITEIRILTHSLF